MHAEELLLMVLHMSSQFLGCSSGVCLHHVVAACHLGPTSHHIQMMLCAAVLLAAACQTVVNREVTDFSWQEDTGGLRSAEDRIIAEMGPYENYIIGLLTNCGTLSLERLHNMLRVFVVGEPKYEGKSQEQLAAFLQIMVTKGKIELNNGIYSKCKAAA